MIFIKYAFIYIFKIIINNFIYKKIHGRTEQLLQIKQIMGLELIPLMTNIIKIKRTN